MALIRATSGSGSGGGKSKSGSLTINSDNTNWYTVNCGFQPTKVYIGLRGTQYPGGYCIYDEELSFYQYAYRSSSMNVLTFANYFAILSDGFKIKSDSASLSIEFHYLAIE